LVGLGFHHVDPNARGFPEALVKLLVGIVVARGIEIHDPTSVLPPTKLSLGGLTI